MQGMLEYTPRALLEPSGQKKQLRRQKRQDNPSTFWKVLLVERQVYCGSMPVGAAGKNRQATERGTLPVSLLSEPVSPSGLK